MRRKIGGGKTVKEKHMEDIWALVGAIRTLRCEFRARLALICLLSWYVIKFSAAYTWY